MLSFGGIAQLGERLNGIQEVRGSNPLISTILWTKPCNRWIYKAFFIAQRVAFKQGVQMEMSLYAGLEQTITRNLHIFVIKQIERRSLPQVVQYADGRLERP